MKKVISVILTCGLLTTGAAAFASCKGKTENYAEGGI